MALIELVEFGFELITEWTLNGNRIKPRSIAKDQIGWLYAFVVDGEVKYIGHTHRPLRIRMDDYRFNTNSQTKRLRESIIAELHQGRTVAVFGWPHSDPHTLTTEELRLLHKHRPAWNRATF